jgi:hypothetical protein
MQRLESPRKISAKTFLFLFSGKPKNRFLKTKRYATKKEPLRSSGYPQKCADTFSILFPSAVTFLAMRTREFAQMVSHEVLHEELLRIAPRSKAAEPLP